MLVKGRFAIRHGPERAHEEGVIGHGVEVHGAIELHGKTARVIEHAPFCKVVGVIGTRKGAHGEGVEGVGGVNVKIAVERLSGGRIARA